MQFGNIRQRDRIFPNGIERSLLTKVDKLPNAIEVEVGTAYLLGKPYKGYTQGKTYIVRNLDGTNKWYDMTLSEFGRLSEPSNIWKRTTNDSIALHWTTPNDIVDDTMVDGVYTKRATWSHDVVVRKFADTPETPWDGEVVGYSDIRDQYKFGDGFICHLDSNDLDSEAYVYRVFSVTISGFYTGSESVFPAWNWQDIKDAVINGTYKDTFRLGDQFDLPNHTKFGILRVTIVSFDDAVAPDGTKRPSITFMTDACLGNMTFDNREQMRQQYTGVARRDMNYFVIRDSQLVQLEEGKDYEVGDSLSNISPLAYHPSVDYWTNNRSDAGDEEQRFGFDAGNACWRDSNLRQWLNSDEPARVWFDPIKFNGMAFDTKPDDTDSAKYYNEAGFIHGFQDKVFVNCVSEVKLTTATDGFVYRKEYKDELSAERDVIVSSHDTIDKFWIPSFEQIYGFSPTRGDAGSYAGVGGYRGEGFVKVSEGSQFGIFVPSAEDKSIGYYISSKSIEILSKGIWSSGAEIQWYLRTCDQTVPSYIYFVGTDVRNSPSSKESSTNTSAPAHRLVGADNAMIGPVVCFTIGNW